MVCMPGQDILCVRFVFVKVALMLTLARLELCLRATALALALPLHFESYGRLFSASAQRRVPCQYAGRGHARPAFGVVGIATICQRGQ